MTTTREGCRRGGRIVGQYLLRSSAASASTSSSSSSSSSSAASVFEARRDGGRRPFFSSNASTTRANDEKNDFNTTRFYDGKGFLKGSQGDRSFSCSSSPVLSWTTTIHNTSGSNNNNIRENSFSNNIQIQRQFFNSRTNPLQFAKGGGKGKASTSSETNDEKKGGSSNNKEGGMSLTHCTGANYFKTGEDPKLLPDEEYPDWLWELAKPQLKISDYEKRKEEYCSEHGEDSDWGDAFTWEEMRKWRKLVRRAKIKKDNALRARK
jgi:large subunit ribosomal protein L54